MSFKALPSYKEWKVTFHIHLPVVIQVSPLEAATTTFLLILPDI